MSRYSFCGTCGMTIINESLDLVHLINNMFTDVDSCTRIKKTGYCSLSCTVSKYGESSFDEIDDRDEE